MILTADTSVFSLMFGAELHSNVKQPPRGKRVRLFPLGLGYTFRGSDLNLTGKITPFCGRKLSSPTPRQSKGC